MKLPLWGLDCACHLGTGMGRAWVDVMRYVVTYLHLIVFYLLVIYSLCRSIKGGLCEDNFGSQAASFWNSRKTSTLFGTFYSKNIAS